MHAAIQGALSEPEPIICLFSTFHIPVGLFQEYWDNYEEKGFARFKWSVLDTMVKCTRGMELATPGDPKALSYCKSCFLSERKEIRDPSGAVVGESYSGCYGYSRESNGWTTFDNVCEAKKVNIGTGVFETEYLCIRPGYSSCIYSPELIEESLTDTLFPDEKDKVAVGIDWGMQTKGSLAIIFAIRRAPYVYIHDILYGDHLLVSDVVKLLNQWRTIHGKFPVIADASHPYNNAELEKAGFDVRPVSFGTWKSIAIDNVSKYLSLGGYE
jgi:hypothetical protein